MLTLPNLLVAVPAALDLKKSIILWYVERLTPLPCRIDRIVSRRSPVPALICGCTRLVERRNPKPRSRSSRQRLTDDQVIRPPFFMGASV